MGAGVKKQKLDWKTREGGGSGLDGKTPSTRVVCPGRALTGLRAPACDAEGSSMKERDRHVQRPSKGVEFSVWEA